MTKDYQDFIIATINESYNVEVEIRDNKLIFPENIKPEIKQSVIGFFNALLEENAKNN
ncbi:hypothetical protein [Mucilaginibacter sp.]|uniref:hypothetical protein n=1 Tax=Mucilaginibacter sp. TaxID=1882438 RepID=UPI0026331D74|nr:hypothetical protein [Mucilaginibacter sp.]MDB5032223.1 hypothetical protein [Mucilaginibacter sp.]